MTESKSIKISLDEVKTEIMTKKDVVFDFEGKEYRPRVLDDEAMQEFQKSLREADKLEAEGGARGRVHALLGRQLEILIGFPPDKVLKMDLAVAKAFLTKVIELSVTLGEQNAPLEGLSKRS